MTKDRFQIIGLVLAIVFVIFMSCFAGNFANENTAKRLLESNGFNKIKLKDRDPFFAGVKGCGKGDLVIFTFSAVNALHKTVTVKVCQGWPLKGATIRSL